MVGLSDKVVDCAIIESRTQPIQIGEPEFGGALHLHKSPLGSNEEGTVIGHGVQAKNLFTDGVTKG